MPSPPPPPTGGSRSPVHFGAEALVGRTYWLGTVCVTPLALLVTEFAGHQRTGDLVAERAVDTLVGALVGFAAAVAVTNRRGRPCPAVPHRRRPGPRERRTGAGRAAGTSPGTGDRPPPSGRRPGRTPGHRRRRGLASGGSARCPGSGSCSPSRRDTVRSRRRYGTGGRSPARARTRRTYGHDGDRRTIGDRRRGAPGHRRGAVRPAG
ncbi:FUSC family protein [Streptomyces sp. SM1]|uniref:FUSC family protein n=1 Tax=Streptomyces sp. SM1 TaxID=402229 RepID=UPI0035BBC92B